MEFIDPAQTWIEQGQCPSRINFMFKNDTSIFKLHACMCCDPRRDSDN